MAFSAPTERPPVSRSSPAVVFRDGLGERRHVADPARGGAVELLCVRPELNSVPSFEFALRERVNRLATFRHAYFAPVRGIERVNDPPDTLAIVSDVTPGIRLSDLLASLEERHIALDITAALCLIRQIVPAVAMLHESARDVAHGAIAPERLVLTPNARLVLVDYVLGAALEQLRYSHERYWAELRVGLPKAGGAPRFDHRADVLQIGLVSLSLILGRALRRDEYPTRVRELVASAWSASANGSGFEPLPPGLCAWLGRTLQLEALTAFPSAIEARAELDKILGDGSPKPSLAARKSSTPAALDDEPLAGPPGAHRPISIPDLPPVTAAPSREPSSLVLPPLAPDAAPKVPSLAALDLTPLAEPVGVERRINLPDLPPMAPAPSKGAPSLVLPPMAAHTTPEGPRLAALDRQLLAEPADANRAVRLEPALAVLSFAARGTAPGALVSDRAVPADVDADQENAPAQPKGFRLWRWIGGAAIVLPALVGGGALTAKRVGAKPSTVGMQLPQHVDLAAEPLPVGQSPGQMEPTGARIETSAGTAKQSNPLGATTTSPGVPPAAQAGTPLASGWIAVSGPLAVQVFERGRLLGSQGARISLPVGAHEIDLVNDDLGYRASRSVDVQPGKGLTVSLDVPKGTIALNALPWAEVWIDGEKVGETPIGNLSLAIGSHDLVFRHPDLGERRQAVVVSLKSPARVSVDLREK